MQLINHIILLGKQAIFQCRHLNMHSSLSLLRAKLKNVYWLGCDIVEQNNVIESHNGKWKAILHHILKPLGVSCVLFLFAFIVFLFLCIVKLASC